MLRCRAWDGHPHWEANTFRNTFRSGFKPLFDSTPYPSVEEEEEEESWEGGHTEVS